MCNLRKFTLIIPHKSHEVSQINYICEYLCNSWEIKIMKYYFVSICVIRGRKTNTEWQNMSFKSKFLRSKNKTIMKKNNMFLCHSV